MKSAFKRSEEFLDLEMQTDKQLEMQQDTDTRNSGFATSESEFDQQQTIQIVVKLDEVEEMISKNWRLVATIPENKAVVEKNRAESDLFELTVGVDWRGFEPLTPRVQGEYSTAELPAHCKN
jgi:hypothetical protein